MRLTRLILLALSLPVIFAQTEPVSNETVVLRAGAFTLTKAEYEKLIPGFDRISGATTTGASNQSVQTGRDAARLLALVSESQRRGMDKDERMQSLIRVRGYTLLANALLLELEKDIKKDSKADDKSKTAGSDDAVSKEKKTIDELIFVVENGKATAVTVKTGIQDANYIELLSGAKEGQTVIKAPFKLISKSLSSGDLVKIVGEKDLFKEEVK